MKFSFFHQRHALSTSFNIFVVTYRVTNFLSKLVDNAISEFPFFEFPFSGITQICEWLQFVGFPAGLHTLRGLSSISL